MMKKFLSVLLFTVFTISLFAQEDENVPKNLASERLSVSMPFGNGKIFGVVRVDKDGMKLSVETVDSLHLAFHLDTDPSVWDYNFRQTLDFANGRIIVQNSFLSIKITTDPESPTVWIQGRWKEPTKFHVEKQGTLILSGEEMLSDQVKEFTLTISPSPVSSLSYRKVETLSHIYWNDFWDRSYLMVSTPDLVTGDSITLAYTYQRWLNATSVHPEDCSPLLATGDWDVLLNYFKHHPKPELMIDYVRYSGDESYLAQTVVPILPDTLTPSISRALLSLPSEMMLPFSLRQKLDTVTVLSNESHLPNAMSDLHDKILRYQNGKAYILPSFPKEWNVRFKLVVPVDIHVWGEYIDGKWRPRPKSDKSLQLVFDY